MKRIRIVELALVCALIITMGVFLFASATSAADIRQSVVRLHIRARSDSPEDQATKLAVRDAVIEATRDALEDCGDAQSARAYIEQNLIDVERAANDSLARLDAGYGAVATFGQAWFPTREYGGVTLPAGWYDSLVIELGGGEGANWWCVMFPTLCYQGDALAMDSSAMGYLQDELDDEDFGAITGGDRPEYEIRFKVLDFFGWLFG